MTTSEAAPFEGTGGAEGSLTSERVRIALTVAGLDPSGGAGLVADIKTFHSLGVYGTAVAATLTCQNSLGLSGRHDVTPGIVRGQLEALLADISPNAVKTGALGRADTIEVVADVILTYELFPIVLDPVFASSDGTPLIGEGGVEAFIDRLLPLATMVTPNQLELDTICGFDTFDLDDVKAAAVWVIKKGARSLLVTGVPLEEEGARYSADLFFDGREFEVFRTPWVEGLGVHGTGCVLSAAVAAHLARGEGLREAAALAREVVASSIAGAVQPGSGDPCANL